MYSPDWYLLGGSWLGAFVSHLILHNNKIIFPKFTREHFDLGVLTVLISGVFVYCIFLPHNIQTAVLSGVAIEDFWKIIKQKSMYVIPEARTTQAPVERDTAQSEKANELREEYEFMKPERDEN